MGLFDLDFQVTSLDPTSFEHVLNSTTAGFWIVMMYAPWCGHCQQFAPKWSQLAKWLADDSRVHVGAIDCIKYSKQCNDLGVNMVSSYTVTLPPYSDHRSTAVSHTDVVASPVGRRTALFRCAS